MRFSRLLALAVPAALLSQSVVSAQVRRDTNGELVNDNNNPGFNGTPNLPFGWSTYSTGLGGGMVGRWDTGGSANANSTKWSDEDPERATVNGGVKVGVYPGGHSLLLGGQTSTVTAGSYGLSQTISSTAGKVYWISGAQGASGDWSTNQNNKYAFHYGVDNGTTVTGGQISTGNIRRSGGGMQNGRWTQAIVATGSQVTAHFGMDSNTANNADINAFVDGVRVYELNAPFNGSLQNGGFESATTDISNYQAKDTTSTGPINAQNDLAPGWIPLGGSAGQRSIYNQVSNFKTSGSNSMQFDMYKGNGRMFLAQRVKLGGAGSIYNLSGKVLPGGMGSELNPGPGGGVFEQNADSNAMIGIDPNGGLDPTSASIVWSSAATLSGSGVFSTLTSTATDTLGNGVTVFLAAGKYTLGQNIRNGASFGGWFDDIQLTPEPTTLGLLAIGSLCLVRRRRTA